MPYHDTEITIPVRVHYYLHKGHPQTRDEPGEPSFAEVFAIEYEEEIIKKTKNGTESRTYKRYGLLAEVTADVICKNPELETECLDSAIEDAFESKINALSKD